MRFTNGHFRYGHGSNRNRANVGRNRGFALHDHPFGANRHRDRCVHNLPFENARSFGRHVRYGREEGRKSIVRRHRHGRDGAGLFVKNRRVGVRS